MIMFYLFTITLSNPTRTCVIRFFSHEILENEEENASRMVPMDKLGHNNQSEMPLSFRINLPFSYAFSNVLITILSSFISMFQYYCIYLKK